MKKKSYEQNNRYNRLCQNKFLHLYVFYTFFSVPLALDLAHCVGFIHTDCVRKTFSSFYVDNCCVDVVVQLSCGG